MKYFFYGIIAYLHDYLDRFEIFFINLIEWAFILAFGYVAVAALVLLVNMVLA